MSTNKIIRSICFYTSSPSPDVITRLDQAEVLFRGAGFEVQTKRICCPSVTMAELEQIYNAPDLFLHVGSLTLQDARDQLDAFCRGGNLNFNFDLTDVSIGAEHVDLLLQIISRNPAKTFNFTYVFNNRVGTPYFPAAAYLRDGFSVGLQSTDLSEGCFSIEMWLENVKVVWNEIEQLVGDRDDFLGIDSSVAPLLGGGGSLVGFLRTLGLDFSRTATTETYLSITRHIQSENPKPIGLCGLMLPCLEDFKLAEEYERGNFTIERNVFLSLHSGLGIDTYPMGIDENPERVLEILRLLQGLSNKYKKPLSCRLISDGKARIGDRTDFRDQYLKDVIVRPL